MITIGDMIEFVIEHRSDKVFRGMDKLSVASLVKDCLENGILYYTAQADKITGMIIATVDRQKKIIFVQENLALTLKNLSTFAKQSRKEYPEYELQYMKHDNFHSPNTNKLYNKLGVI